MKRALEVRIADPIPPIHEDVVRHFLERGLRPITKLPRQCIVDYSAAHHGEVLIVHKMEGYWFREALLEFPELVEQYPWAHARAVFSNTRGNDAQV
jgi:hypothetical protein